MFDSIFKRGLKGSSKLEMLATAKSITRPLPNHCPTIAQSLPDHHPTITQSSPNHHPIISPLLPNDHHPSATIKRWGKNAC
jgi:hypothetical protein